MNKALALLALLATPAFGLDLVTTLDRTPAAYRAVSDSIYLAASFLTGPTGWSVDGAKVRLSNTSYASGTATFYLYDAAGSSGTPGSQVALLGSVNVATVPTTFTNYTFNINPLSLAPSRRYWIVGQGPGMFRSVNWETESLSNAIGYSNLYSNVGTWSPPNYALYTMGLSIVGNPVPVPEVPPILASIAVVSVLIASRYTGRNPNGNSSASTVA